MPVHDCVGEITIEVPAEVVKELSKAAAFIDRQGVPLEMVNTQGLELGATKETMAIVLEYLNDPSQGVVVLGRIPVESYDCDMARIIYTLMGQSLAPMVDQKYAGVKSYSVRDLGENQGKRRSTTNLEQDPHTDGAWLSTPPEYIGLGCIKQSLTGGESLIWDLKTIHDYLNSERRFTQIVERLYRPFCWDRQGEHADGEQQYTEQPIFWTADDQVRCRWYLDYIECGYELAKKELTQTDLEALNAVKNELANLDPELHKEFRLGPGFLLYVNNYRFAHARRGFESGSEREMLRSWHRRTGRYTLEGV